MQDAAINSTNTSSYGDGATGAGSEDGGADGTAAEHGTGHRGGDQGFAAKVHGVLLQGWFCAGLRVKATRTMRDASKRRAGPVQESG